MRATQIYVLIVYTVYTWCVREFIYVYVLGHSRRIFKCTEIDFVMAVSTNKLLRRRRRRRQRQRRRRRHIDTNIYIYKYVQMLLLFVLLLCSFSLSLGLSLSLSHKLTYSFCALFARIILCTNATDE